MGAVATAGAALIAGGVLAPGATAVPPSSSPSWAQQFGTVADDTIGDVAVSRTGVVYSVGQTAGSLSGTNAGSADIWIARHNPSGTRRWTRQFGTSAIDYVYGIAISPRGDIYVVGASEGSLVGTNTGAGTTDAFLAKYDANGRRRWIRQIASTDGEDDDAHAIAIGANDEIYVAGTTTGDLAAPDANQGNSDVWLARYDRNGNRIWLRQNGTNDVDQVTAVTATSSGRIYIYGNTDGSLPGTASNIGSSDFFLMGYDRTGTHQGNVQWGTVESDIAAGAALGPSDELYVTGRTNGTISGATSAGGQDAVLYRFDMTPVPGISWSVQTGTDQSDDFSDVVVRNTDVFVVGNTVGNWAAPSTGAYDLVVARYGTTGQRRWIDQFGSTDQDFSRKAAISRSGDLYFGTITSGTLGTSSIGSGDAALIKYSASRNQTWVAQTASTGNDYFYGIATAPGGASWSVGSTGGPGWGGTDGNVDILVAKHDASGNELLVRRLGTSETDYALGAAAGPAGSVVVVGVTQGDFSETNGGTSIGDNDGFVMLIDSAGETVWKRQIGSIYYDQLSAVAVTARGDIYVTGQAGASVEGLTHAGDSDFIVAKYDRNGTRKWLRQFGTPSAEYSYGIGVSRTGAVFVAGSGGGTFSAPSSETAVLPVLLRYDTNGNRKWAKQYPVSSGAGDFNAIAVTPFGDVYTTGTVSGVMQPGGTFGGTRDFVVAKADRNGNLRWVRQYGGANIANSDRGYGIAVTPSGTVTVVGTTEGTLGTTGSSLDPNPNAGEDDIVLMRFDRNGNRTAYRQWGTSTYDEATAVAVTSRGTAYIAANTPGRLAETQAGDMDAFTIRFNT